ncbi:outer membrane protein [Steroidobacter agaridevorans]|uniref:Outer membrane protein n=1 Tax=Steroidobacter agaridevorans TaxID=2695856 RepID=A0A829YFQ6_9GAMM|nr:efflux transporter outer membrane subunit [Steroidobacter agaridevorans]GFE82104.1 outer membrane protein [Steroidobacter agaridevorans]
MIARFCIVWASVLAVTSGCATPGVRQQAATFDEVPTASLQAASSVGAHWPTSSWWQEFADPALDRLVVEALTGHPSIRIAQSRVLRADAIARETGGRLYPQLSANANLTRLEPFDTAVRPPGIERPTVDAARMTLNFSYEFDFWQRNRAAFTAALSEAVAIEAEASDARNVLATAVTSTYVRLRAALSQLEIAQSGLKRRQHLLDLVQDRERAGLDVLVSVKQAQSEAEIAQADVVRMEHAVQLLRNQLAALLGSGPERAGALGSPLGFSYAMPELPQIVPADLLGRRPDIVASRQRVTVAARNVQVARADFLPNVNLFALIGLDALAPTDFFSGTNRAWSAGAAVHLPLFDGGRLRARLDARSAEYDIAVEAYNATVLTAIREAADALTGLTKSTEALTPVNAALLSADEAYQLTLERYRNGLANYIAVLIVENALQARQALNVQAREQQLVSLALTFKALGGGFEAATL